MSLQSQLSRLIDVTLNCNEVMHEPDNEGLKIVVSGYHLDNAMGNEPSYNCGEFTVGFTYDDGASYTWINLADIIALARKAQI